MTPTHILSGLALPLAALVACGPEQTTAVPEAWQILLGKTHLVDDGHSTIAALRPT